MDTTCATKYPIMLIHGIGYCDADHRRYWGRIPSFLEKHGAILYFGNQDAFGSIEHNASQLKCSVLQALEESAAEKLNLIAHSTGGIEARYLISRMGMSEKIASLTTLATPHRGIKAMDHIKQQSGFLYKQLLRIFNLMLVMDGRQKNCSLGIYDLFTTDFMGVFNEIVPDVGGVYYQSYAFDMKNSKSDPSMGLFYQLVKYAEGANDGLVSVESAKWGDFQGVYSGTGGRGISHPGAVDSRQGKLMKNSRIDILDLYWDLVSRLKAMGY